MSKHRSDHSPIQDPHARRESERYDNPIASREYILEILGKASGPLTKEQLADILGLVDDEPVEALRRRLYAMERDGQICSNREQAYTTIDTMNMVHGLIQAHKGGFGFLIPHDGTQDVYLSHRQMCKVFDGDEALVRLVSSHTRGRREGKLVKIIADHSRQLVGRYVNEHGIAVVRPDNPRITQNIMIPPEHSGGAKNNQLVMIEVTRYPKRQTPAMGKVIEVLGDYMAPGMEIEVAIRAHDLPHHWPEPVQVQAEALPVEVAETDKIHRVDLRKLPFVTIDGEDARDFDDAVYCQPKKSGGWRLFVAIADVSHYVAVGSPLDDEAEARGTSVYFPDFVLPMLPEALSNGLCSLNPNVDRLAMVCEMTISAAGRISGYEFYESVIHSHARLTYTQVGNILEGREESTANTEGQTLREYYGAIVDDLDHLHGLYRTLRKVRERRGAIDFDTTETRIIFDKQRKIKCIVPVVRNDAHKLIEECMLCANVCAARFLEKHDLDGLYRVHQGPKEQKLENLRTFLGELGLAFFTRQHPEPADYQRLVSHVADRPDAKVIQTVMLRSLSQAMYQPDNEGHFGLAYPAYTHFTSPIRRYPDLLTHRAIRHIIRSRNPSVNVRRVKGAGIIARKRIYPYGPQDMASLGEQTSMAERRADDASRDVVSWLKCEYLQDHLGDIYQGVVTAVTHFGVFVELLDVYVEGLVHITSLPSDYYHYEEAHHRLIGERTRQTFCLGDELTVQVASVNLDERKVDFELMMPHGLDSETARTKRESVRDKLRRGDFSGLDSSTPSQDRRRRSAFGDKNNRKRHGKKTTAKTSTHKTTIKKSSAKKSATGPKRTVRKRKVKR